MAWTSDALSGQDLRVPRDPSDEDVVDLVELWAKAGGHWGPDARWVNGNWLVLIEGHDGIQMRGAPGPICIRYGPNPDDGLWFVDADTLLVWALGVISDRTVDLGRCPACEGSGEPETESIGAEGSRAHRYAARKREQGWTVQTVRDPESYRERLTCTRACECIGTGRDIRAAARLVLDAAPRDRDCSVCGGSQRFRNIHGRWVDCDRCNRGRVTDSGDPKAIEHLHVFKDQWESDGDPLGPAAANWLRQMELGERIEGWRGVALAGVLAAWARLTVPCGNCTSPDWVGVRAHCVPCGGHGRVKP